MYKNNRNRCWARLAAGVMLVVGLAGCNSNVKHAPTLSASTPLPSGNGIVLARIINASGQPLPYNYLTVAAKDVNASLEEKPFRLSAIDEAVGSSTLFASHLPAGQYTVSSLGAYYSAGEMYYSRWVRSDATSGTFSVRDGGVTDLGTLVYYPKVQGDKMIDMLGRSPISVNPQLIDAHLPYLDYDWQDALSWNENDIQEDKNALYLSMLQNPLTYHARLKAADGSIYFVGKLGTILSRSAEGEWNLDAVDSDSDLNAIAQNVQGDLVVGGDFGTLYLKPSGGEWESIEIDQKQRVDAIKFHNDRFVDVISHSHTNLMVRRADIGEKPLKWKTMLSYNPNESVAAASAESDSNRRVTNRARRIDRVSLETIDTTHYLVIDVQPGTRYSPLLNSQRLTYRFDPDSWETVTATGVGADVDRIVSAGTTTLGIKRPTFFSLTQDNKYYRFNTSKGEWEKISNIVDRCPSLGDGRGLKCKSGDKIFTRRPPFSFASAPVFTSDSHAVAFVRFSDSSSAAAERHTALAETHDGGQSWAVAGREPPGKYCTDTVPEAEGVLLIYCEGITSDFYESYDHGRTWQHVKEHQNF